MRNVTQAFSAIDTVHSDQDGVWSVPLDVRIGGEEEMVE